MQLLGTFPGPGLLKSVWWSAHRKAVLECAGAAPAAPGHVQPGRGTETLTNSRAPTDPEEQAGEQDRGWGVGPVPSVLQLTCMGGTHRELAATHPRELGAQVCCLVG